MDPRALAPGGNRIPFLLPACRIARDTPGDPLHVCRASAPERSSRRPAGTKRRSRSCRMAAHHRLQQLAHSHHPSIQRGPADLHSRVPLQDRSLPVQRQMIRILGDHRLHHHAVTCQSLLHDARRQRRHRHRACLAAMASTLLALDHPHEIARRLNIQLLTLVVADHGGFRATLPARLFRATDYFLHPRQILRQALPPRMRPALAPRSFGQRRPLRLRLYFIQRRARFLVGQQFQLQIVQRLAASAPTVSRETAATLR